jgi:hypothetical protein
MTNRNVIKVKKNAGINMLSKSMFL